MLEMLPLYRGLDGEGNKISLKILGRFICHLAKEAFLGKLEKVLNTFFHEKTIHGRGVTVNSDTFIKLNVLWSEPLSCHYSSYIVVGGPLKSVNVLHFFADYSCRIH